MGILLFWHIITQNNNAAYECLWRSCLWISVGCWMSANFDEIILHCWSDHLGKTPRYPSLHLLISFLKTPWWIRSNSSAIINCLIISVVENNEVGEKWQIVVYNLCLLISRWQPNRNVADLPLPEGTEKNIAARIEKRPSRERHEIKSESVRKRTWNFLTTDPPRNLLCYVVRFRAIK